MTNQDKPLSYAEQKAAVLARYHAAQDAKHKKWAAENPESVEEWKRKRDANRSPEEAAARLAEWKERQTETTEEWKARKSAEGEATKPTEDEVWEEADASWPDVEPLVVSPAQRSLDAALWASRQEDAAVSTVEPIAAPSSVLPVPVSAPSRTTYVDGSGVVHTI